MIEYTAPQATAQVQRAQTSHVCNCETLFLVGGVHLELAELASAPKKQRQQRLTSVLVSQES